MKPNVDQQNEKLSAKFKNMVKMFPVATSILNKNKNEPNKKKDSEDFGFDINGLNHKPIEDCDALFEDCSNFLKLAKDTIQFTTQSANPSKLSALGLGMGSKINKWRAKRKGNHLFLMFEGLQERMEVAETQLKTLNDESQRNSGSLMLQSLHLKARLTSCIDYNKKIADDMKPIIAEASSLMEHFASQERALQSMLVFYDEVVVLSKNQPYVPWAMRSSATSMNDGDEAKPAEVKVTRSSMVKRHKKLQKIRLIVEHNLDVVSKKYEVHQSNHTHCSRVLHSMNKLLHKISEQNAKRVSAGRSGTTIMNNPIISSSTSISASTSSPNAASESSATDSATDPSHSNSPSLQDNFTQKPVSMVQNSAVDDEEFLRQHLGEYYAQIEPYNHANCSDCTCVYSMANECLMHLAASQHQSQECSLRLTRLVQDFKERMKEDADKLEALDWGGHNHVHLA